MRIEREPALTFDDVVLVPKLNRLGSRFGSNISTTTQITPQISLEIPIISANMDTVTEYEMANAFGLLGGLGIIHRFLTPTQHANQLNLVSHGPRVACIGVGDKSKNALSFIMDNVNNIIAVLIDIAHAHCPEMTDQINWCKKKYPNLDVIGGNVSTKSGVRDLFNAGADCVKVGQGAGSVCSTRINTGNGLPQLTTIIEAAETDMGPIIADGGIRYPGDIVKALAAGADAVMLGKMLSGTTETPGETLVEMDGRRYKAFRGMASRAAQASWKGIPTSVEGESMCVPARGSVQDVIRDIVNNLRSGMTYQNAATISDLQTGTVFRRQTPAGVIEAKPHGLTRDWKEI